MLVDTSVSFRPSTTINKITINSTNRRKFGSQTSDNMDRWKSTPRQKLKHSESQKGEDKRWRKSEARRCRCAKEKGKSRSIVFSEIFPMICGSGGSKSRLAKAAGTEPAGQMKDEKLHAVVARSTCGSESVKHHMLRALLEVEMSKKCTSLWCEAHWQVKSVKNSKF